MSAVASMEERILAPADALRRTLLRAAVPIAGPLVADREARVALLATGMIVSAFAGSALFPLWMLALGPVVWGIPHVVADVRYLAVRTGFWRRGALWGAVGLPLTAVAAGAGTWVGLLAPAGAALVARGASGGRRFATLAAAIFLAALAREGGYAADVAFAHLHNLAAILLWWGWRRRERWLHIAPLAACGAAAVAILGGALDPVLLPRLAPGCTFAGADAASMVPAWPLAGGVWTARLACLFAFGQAVHYAVWLRLVPEEDRARPSPPSLRSAWRSLRTDLGRWIPAAAALSCAALGIWALSDLAAARDGYLRVARFHGHLELAAAALFWLEGRSRPAPGGDAAG